MSVLAVLATASLNSPWGQEEWEKMADLREMGLHDMPLSPQGLYVFAVYVIMHNQLCWPTKASYTVEMSGHEGPDSSYQGGGPAGAGGDINKSTQNLISAMEEVTMLHPHFTRRS